MLICFPPNYGIWKTPELFVCFCRGQEHHKTDVGLGSNKRLPCEVLLNLVATSNIARVYFDNMANIKSWHIYNSVETLRSASQTIGNMNSEHITQNVINIILIVLLTTSQCEGMGLTEKRQLR